MNTRTLTTPENLDFRFFDHECSLTLNATLLNSIFTLPKLFYIMTSISNICIFILTIHLRLVFLIYKDFILQYTYFCYF